MSGTCLCGSIKFEITGNLPNIYQCHCSLCRKVSGSSSNSAMLVDAKHFEWVKGSDQIKRYTTATGFKSEFCDTCGSPVPNLSRDGKLVWIPAGLLDNPLDTSLAIHLYVDSKANWDTAFANDTTPQHGQMPEMDELLQLLHQKSTSN